MFSGQDVFLNWVCCAWDGWTCQSDLKFSLCRDTLQGKNFGWLQLDHTDWILVSVQLGPHLRAMATRQDFVSKYSWRNFALGPCPRFSDLQPSCYYRLCPQLWKGWCGMLVSFFNSWPIIIRCLSAAALGAGPFLCFSVTLALVGHPTSPKANRLTQSWRLLNASIQSHSAPAHCVVQAHSRNP